MMIMILHMFRFKLHAAIILNKRCCLEKTNIENNLVHQETGRSTTNILVNKKTKIAQYRI